MYRFYSPIQNITQDKIILSDKKHVHHLRDVLRLKAGDRVIIFDNKGNECTVVVEELSSRTQRVTFLVKDRHKVTPHLKRIKITVACAMPKKSKMDDIVDKLTQLGIDRIIPLETERVIIRLDKQKKILRQRRWKKIALSASQQSGRCNIPIVDPVKDIDEVLSDSKVYDLKIIPTLLEGQKSLKEIFIQANPKNVLVLIGPEGDFTQKEINLAKKQGCLPVSLGDLVLRVETAAVAVASFMRFYENS